MTGHVPGGILRAAQRIASTIATIGRACVHGENPRRQGSLYALVVLFSMAASAMPARGAGGEVAVDNQITKLKSFTWDFGRSCDRLNDKFPDGWKRVEGIGYPKYVRVEIAPRDPDLEQQCRTVDTAAVRAWQELIKVFPKLPFPPSIADLMVNRYLRVQLDGGQAEVQSPAIAANRVYQYRFSCQIKTERLRHTSARAELVFLDENEKEITAHSTPSFRGTTDWMPISLELVRPPIGAAKMLVRLIVERGEDGLEDIRGTIGFDDIRIDQYPQLRVTTDEPLGVYAYGRPILATAKIMGLPAGASEVEFRLFDSNDQEVTSQLLSVQREPNSSRAVAKEETAVEKVDSEVTWKLPRLGPGYYRITAALAGRRVSTLSTATSVAVVDQIIGGPPHGAFGWTLPQGNSNIPPREFATWLTSLGVAWVKFPCWIAPEDSARAEEIATIVSKLQDAGIQTVGMLDVPPEEQIPMYSLRGRRDLVAAQLFRDLATWQPLLEPVMTRLTLKVRTWQLGGDRDHSFMGRPRLREAVSQISTGLQGFGQPIEVAISWPWLETQLPDNESSWQAVCRSTDPPLGAKELDAFLSMSAGDKRSDGPRTWLLLDPIPQSQYDRESRIRDLVLRMATVRRHRVQAAFVSNPRDPEQGLLQSNGRPGELLLPWRTTSRLIGNLREVGSLQLKSGAQNLVFAGADRAVLMLWSAEPTEEMIYLGDNVQAVDVWGRVSNLPTIEHGNQYVQRVKTGPVPKFLIGVDPTLLAFRMSVDVEQKQIDSFLGQTQKLGVSFANPTRDSLIGEMRLLAPTTWSVEAPARSWEALAGRSATQEFDVVLSNTATIGKYELPIQFEIDTVPPKIITVYRDILVGPEGLEFDVTTRLLRSGDLSVQLEITNLSGKAQSYDCMLFPPPGRQYRRQFITIEPGETIRREIHWPDGTELIGKRMLLRADEQDGQRVLNYAIDVTR